MPAMTLLESPILVAQTTADVNSARSPNIAQGWLLFSGDADNGTVPGGNANISPGGPFAPPLCLFLAPGAVNDNTKDDFDPTAPGAVNLDTGLTVNTCANTTDGSRAVIFEFRTFHIRSGVIVRARCASGMGGYSGGEAR